MRPQWMDERDEEVLQYVRLHLNDMTYKEIGERFHMTDQNVQRIARKAGIRKPKPTPVLRKRVGWMKVGEALAVSGVDPRTIHGYADDLSIEVACVNRGGKLWVLRVA